jgi:hypothetical protein
MNVLEICGEFESALGLLALHDSFNLLSAILKLLGVETA